MKTSAIFNPVLFFSLVVLLFHHVVYAGDKYQGEFVLLQDKKWVEISEDGANLNDFIELARTQWTVTLEHTSKNKGIYIDLSSNTIYEFDLSTPQQNQLAYRIMSPSDQSVSGFDASRVSYAATTVMPPIVSFPNGRNGLHGYPGYGIAPTSQPVEEFDAGIGFYTSVWPLISQPYAHFQIGLPSIWLTPDNRGDHTALCPVGSYARDNWPERRPSYHDVYQTLEGGVGYWAATRFQTGKPKFSMNATTQCYDYQVASSGWPFFNSSRALDDNKMAIAQLSNRLIVPPDALTFKGTPNGEVMGYTWMALPLNEPDYLGEFTIKDGGGWVEIGKNGVQTTHYQETGRDQWSVYLENRQLNKKIQLDLWTGEIYHNEIGSHQNKKHLYNIALPTGRQTTGFDVSRVIFSSTQVAPHSSNVPTGENSWTLFVNAMNFKGPLAFYIPESWSRIASVFNYLFDIGKGLDTKLASPGAGSGAMEINTVPYFSGVDRTGAEYTKIPPLYFPVDSQNRSVLARDLKLYSKKALSDMVAQWRKGGAASTGDFSTKGIELKLKAHSTVYRHKGMVVNGINGIAKSSVFDDGKAWGIQWLDTGVMPVGQFPRYFKREGNRYQVVAKKDVPVDTGLQNKAFASVGKGAAYTSPNTGAWVTPGGDATTYKVALNDGSIVTYKWYRFIDQPAFQQFNFSAQKKQKLQTFIEKIHAQWTIYL